MGQNRNIGADSKVVVFGEPESFRMLIKNHGQMCKIKQCLPCPCLASNYGTPNMDCEQCGGTGYTYTYQRRFLIADEDSRSNKSATELYPWWIPVMEVTKVERLTSIKQGGIIQMKVKGFNDTTIFVENPNNEVKQTQAKRVTYFMDGWTKIEGDQLKVSEKHRLMWPTKTYYDAKYQSSNPLLAEADICKIIKVYNKKTGKEYIRGKDFTLTGNTFICDTEISEGDMYADYYCSDLTQIITADLKTKDDVIPWTNDMESGVIRLAMYPWYNITKGDIVVVAADAQYRNELFTHHEKPRLMDQLWELEIFELNDVAIDDRGGKYYREEDYILVGNRYIKWISENRPKEGAVVSMKYGYKPTFICFEDNPEPNNLENRRYPKIIYVKRWSKTRSDDIHKLEATNG